MLDYFAIFTKGGALLWTLQFTTALKHNPLDALNALIRTCLLEERSGDAAFTYVPKVGAQQALKWTFHNVSQMHCCGAGQWWARVAAGSMSAARLQEQLHWLYQHFQYTVLPFCSGRLLCSK
jgi:hypothetical protein